MKYKIGNNVFVKIEIFKNKSKKISIFEPKKDSQIEIKSFLIVAIDEKLETYKIIIDDDIYGWNISKFHTKYEDVNEKLIGKKFYDISESLILKKE